MGAIIVPKDTNLKFSDNTTNDVSTSQHGFTPKAPNDTNKFLRGDGTWNPADFTAIFQVPGGLASVANIMGRIIVPKTVTGSYISGYLNTPASVASVWVQINKNGSIYGVLGFLAGATYASSASIATAGLVAGNYLEGDIRSTASLASDLSLIVQAA